MYYTCLKRLSTFFTIVAVGTDYCIWMTGSPPSTIRFHLLNAGEDDAVKLCIWFKTTNRKDVYKVINTLILSICAVMITGFCCETSSIEWSIHRASECAVSG